MLREVRDDERRLMHGRVPVIEQADQGGDSVLDGRPGVLGLPSDGRNPDRRALPRQSTSPNRSSIISPRSSSRIFGSFLT
jgi:hypothetical protein